MVNGVTYFCVYIPEQGACLDETSVFSNAVRFALKLFFAAARLFIIQQNFISMVFRT